MNDSYPANPSGVSPRGGRGLGAVLSRYWIPLFAIGLGLYAGLPWLAPVFMHIGWSAPGILIQKIYSTQCHQLPDRSFFMFGPQVTYPLPQIQAAWQNTYDPAVLRQFIGNAQMGWKVAWSDRMVAMYTSAWVFALLYWVLRRRVHPLPLWGLVLLWAPMAIDGGTHFISDLLGGVDAGFRYDNGWLASLTGQAFPAWFYNGNTLGSFNSDMRLLTGILFGLGLIWFALPIIDESIRQTIKWSARVPQPAADPAVPESAVFERTVLEPAVRDPLAAEKKEAL